MPKPIVLDTNFIGSAPYAVYHPRHAAQCASLIGTLRIAGYARYTAVFNAFKRLSKGYSADERTALFHNTAARAYRIAA